MKISILALSLSFLALVSAQDCGNQKCYKYLSGKKNHDAKTVKRDCLSYLEATSTLTDTTTTTLPITTTTTVYETTIETGYEITLAADPLPKPASHKTLPPYASHSCYEPLATSKYTSACNCLGYYPTTTFEYIATETEAQFTVTTTVSVPACDVTLITSTATETETETETLHHSMTETVTSTLTSTLPGNFSYITYTSFLPITYTERSTYTSFLPITYTQRSTLTEISTSVLLSTETATETSTLTSTTVSSCPPPGPTEGCAPQFCGGYNTPCGPGGSCICVGTTEGGSFGYCGEGSSYCSGLSTCGSSSECGAGYICAVGTCCDVNVCLPAGTCMGYQGKNIFNKETGVKHKIVYADTVGMKAGKGVKARAAKFEE
ncbi:hypothetical protein BJ508DRAFT_50236 [Ascobolus immersus RN42]|uniref:Chitin-binding type-1 domain-containing protein n=1 Tax=Ascobolus immersus RN42 TaxID=1160509 RepID=A0A3N4HUM3_ASCIM|nr:hypothetical protein BJ508DRAFT_50236 [Ascobolus immersus RN42]